MVMRGAERDLGWVEPFELRRSANTFLQHRRELVKLGRWRRVQDQLASHPGHDLIGGTNADEPQPAREHSLDRIAFRVLMPLG